MKTKNHKRIRITVLVVLAIFAVFVFAQSAKAAVNKMINYQGKLTNTSGWAVADGSYDMRLKLYDDPTVGTLLWAGTHTAANGNAVAVSRGIFSILLGSGTGNALTLDFTTDAYYLQVEIYNTGTSQWETFNNRKRFGSVPQAINSLNVVGNGYVDIDNTATAQDAMNINYNPASGSNDALEITYGSGGTGTALKVTQSGTGYAATFMGGNVGIGMTNPTALLSLAGSTTSRASLNIASGTGPSSPIEGDFWYNGTNLYFKPSGAQKDLLASGGADNLGNHIMTANLQTSGYWISNDGGNEGIWIKSDGNVGIGTTGPGSKLDVTTAGLAATQTTSSGLALVNTTAATALAAVQISPAVRWSGFGWKTDAIAASQAVDFRSFVVPVQGAANPTGYLSFGSSVNDAAYSDGQMVITTAGNVGIGTTAPGAFLHILGDTEQLRLGHDVTNYASFTTGDDSKLTIQTSVVGSQSMITVGSGTTQDAGISFDGNINDYCAGMDDATDKFMIGFGQVVGTAPYITMDSSGNVGIGMTNPTALLSLAGSTTSRASLNIASGTGPSSPIEGDFWYNGTNLYFKPSGAQKDLLASGGADNLGNHIMTANLQTSGYWISNDGGNEGIWIKSDGNVGIGTTDPTSILAFGGDVARTIQLEARTTNSAGSALTVAAGAGGAGSVGVAGGALNLLGGAAVGTTGAAAGGNIVINGGAGINTGARGNVILADLGGNVGIGTTDPASYNLQVTGTGGFSTSVNSPLFQGQSAVTTLGNASYGTVINGSSFYFNATSVASHAAVGVYPKFDVVSNTASDYLSAFDYYYNNDAGPAFYFSKSRSGTKGTMGYPLGGDELGEFNWAGADEATNKFDRGVAMLALTGSTWTSTSHEAYLAFYTVPSGSKTLNQRLVIGGSGQVTINQNLVVSGASNSSFAGNVGIGTTGPGNKLEIWQTSSLGAEKGGIFIYSNDYNTSNALVAFGNDTGNSSPTVTYSRALLAGFGSNPTAANNYGVWGHQYGPSYAGYGVLATNGATPASASMYVALAGATYSGIFMGGNVGIGTTNPLAFLHLAASTTAKAQMRLNVGVAPSTPAEGDLWYNGTNLYFKPSGTVKDLLASGGAQTPWAQDINAAGFDLNSLSNILFQETTVAPIGTDVAFYRDTAGDLSANVLTGKTFNIGVNLTDEYNFSSSGLAFNSNNITGLGTNLTAAAGLTVASAAASGLTINSGTTGTLAIGDDASVEIINIATGGAAKTLTIGSTNTTSSTKIQSGSGNIGLEANNAGTGNVQIGDGGAASATPDFLVTDIGSGDSPTGGTNGAMFYSTSSNKFRCYEGVAWKDCDTTGGGGVSDGDKGDVTVSGTGATWMVDYTSTDGAGATSNASGMEEGTGGIGLLQGCSDGQVLKWTESTSVWSCATDSTTSGTTTKYLTANHANSTTTGTRVDSITTTLAPGTYTFTYSLIVQSATTTVGPMFGINFSTGTAAVRSFAMRWADGSTGLAAYTDNMDDEGVKGVGVIAGMASKTFSTTVPNLGTTVGVTTINSNTPAWIEGILVVTVSGNLELWHSSETATSTTLMANSSLVITQISAGADLAEIYGTKDTSIEPGDVVSLDSSLKAGVKKSDKPYDSKAIGIIATQPSLVMGTVDDPGATPVMVALAGRVPVKVTNENGSIKPGDLLTSSSTPGVAMRATKAGQVIGQAMTPFNGEGVGLVLAFIKTDYANGGKIADFLPGLSQEGIQPSANNIGKLALAQFISQKEQLATSVDLSEIVTDRLAAGLEIITPKVTAEIVALDKLEAATGLDIAVNLADGGALKINNSLTGKNGITFDSAGNATFQGTLTADAIVANKILGLEIFTNQISGIDENVAVLTEKLTGLQTAEETIDLSSLGILEKKSGLAIAKETTFKEATIFEKLVTLVGNVIFRGEVSFEKNPTFNQDMAGYAIVKEGSDTVSVEFENEYAVQPIVNASLSLQYIKDEETRKASEELLLVSSVNYIITNVTTNGFEIRINQPALSEISFSWQALAVKDAKTFKSQDIVTDTDKMPAGVVPIDASQESTPGETVLNAPAAAINESTLPAQTPTSEQSNVTSDTPVSPSQIKN